MPDPGRAIPSTTREAVATAYRRLLELGLVTGTAGTVSARTAGGMVITPSAVPPADVTAECLCAMDLDTGLIDGNRPSSEWLLHTEVYERSPAGAVVHTHSMAATAVSLLVDQLPAVHYHVARLGPVPVVPYATCEPAGALELGVVAGSCTARAFGSDAGPDGLQALERARDELSIRTPTRVFA